MTEKISFVTQFISNTQVIPLISNKDFEKLKHLCKCIINSGCKIIEFGIRYENSIENYSKLQKFIKSEYDGVIFGAGSVSDLEVAKKIIDYGTDFIIGPGYDEFIKIECEKSKKLYIPGCSTATECINAKNSGIKLVKIFPANHLGGISFVKALKSAMPWLKFIPAGGIAPNPREVNLWLKAGATAVTLGSVLFREDLVRESNFIQIENTLSDIIQNKNKDQLLFKE